MFGGDAVARFVGTLNKKVTTLYLSGATISVPLTILESVTTLYLGGARGQSNLTIPKKCKVQQ